MQEIPLSPVFPMPDTEHAFDFPQWDDIMGEPMPLHPFDIPPDPVFGPVNPLRILPPSELTARLEEIALSSAEMTAAHNAEATRLELQAKIAAVQIEKVQADASTIEATKAKAAEALLIQVANVEAARAEKAKADALVAEAANREAAKLKAAKVANTRIEEASADALLLQAAKEAELLALADEPVGDPEVEGDMGDEDLAAALRLAEEDVEAEEEERQQLLHDTAAANKLVTHLKKVVATEMVDANRLKTRSQAVRASAPATSTSAGALSLIVQVPKCAPEWIHVGAEYLADSMLGADWSACIKAWVGLKKKMEYADKVRQTHFCVL
jgi:hypothetical protein